MSSTRAAARRPGRPPVLSRDRIVDVALASGNVDTLTMRELAERLGVSHGALYRWVDGRDALTDLVGEVVIDRVLPERPATVRSWRSWLRAFAWSMHDEFLAVPGFASRTARPHRHNAEAYERMTSAVTSAFTAAGTANASAHASCDAFVTAVVGWLAMAESAGTTERDDDFAAYVDMVVRGLPVRPVRPPDQDRRRNTPST